MTEEKRTEILAIVADIERLDRETKGQFRQASDREALDIVSRIERKLSRRLASKGNAA